MRTGFEKDIISATGKTLNISIETKLGVDRTVVVDIGAVGTIVSFVDY